MSHSLASLATVTLDLPLEETWSRLADYSVAHNYVPGLTRTEIVSAVVTGPGAHRRVYTGDKFIEETIVDWREGQGFTMRLHRGVRPMPPFKSAEFDYQLSPRGADQTRVTLTLRVTLPWGIIGSVLGRALILPAMNKQLAAVAAGMKHFYETGAPATDEDRKRLAAAVETTAASG